MFRPKFVFRNEAGDGADGGGAGNMITPSKWGAPDGMETFTPNDGGDGGEGGAGDDDEAARQAAADAEAAAAAAAAGNGNSAGGAAAAGGDNGGGAAANQDDYPEFIREAIRAHKEGKFNQDDFINRYQGIGDIDKAPSETVIREFYTKKHGLKSDENPNGVTQEEIDAYIGMLKEKNILDFTARDFRPQLKNMVETEKQQQYDQQFDQVINLQKENLNNLFAITEKYDNIYGVKVSKPELEAFNKEVEDFLLPKKGEQVVPMYVTEKFAKLLSNDETLYQMLFAATREAQIKDNQTRAKESTKRAIEDKLGLRPNVGGGSPSAHNSGTVTPSLWSIPEE